MIDKQEIRAKDEELRIMRREYNDLETRYTREKKMTVNEPKHKVDTNLTWQMRITS